MEVIPLRLSMDRLPEADDLSAAVTASGDLTNCVTCAKGSCRCRINPNAPSITNRGELDEWR